MTSSRRNAQSATSGGQPTSALRVYAVAVTRPPAPAQRSSFACAYAADADSSDDRSSEEWARTVWEGAPGAVRWLLRTGWRFVLRLPVGPRGSPDTVLGWPIVERSADQTVCHLQSPFLDAYNTFRLENGRFVWSTFVYYRSAAAKLVWPPVSAVHHPIAKAALRRAQRR